jgi:tetratricopeptide (TPR) repeat protein
MQETGLLAQYKFFALLILLNLNIQSQTYYDPKIDSLLKSGIEHLINQNYSSSKITFSFLDEEFPGLPLGKIYLASVEIAKSYDYSEEFNDDFISSILDDASSQSDSLLDKDPDNIWYNYFSALAEGYSAYYNALTGDWINAFAKGVTAINRFEKCLEAEPLFYEALIALGTFKYWKSRKTEFLNWLPLIEDETEEGIYLLKRSIEGKSYNNFLAVNSLVWIYIDKADYEGAIRLCKEELKKYPGCRTIKWALARGYEDVDRNESIKVYNEILKSYPPGNSSQYNEVVLKHLIAQQYYKMGQSEKALFICEEILNRNDLTDISKERLKERLLKVKILYKKLKSR